MILEMVKNNFNLGGEQSGHIILGDFMRTGDGILVALKIVEMLSKNPVKASQLFNLYKKYPQIKDNIKIDKILSISTENKINLLTRNFESKYKDLRFLVRKSGTEPLLRVLVEGYDDEVVEKASTKLINNIKKIINAK